jgi:transposase
MPDSLSPDLSPIEHLWDELGRRVRHRQNPPETLQELRDALVHEWNNIPQAFIQRLQKKRYKGLMLNMFYREKKISKNRII